MDIGHWLNAIGLGQYETLFREHEIDTDVLVDLTEADLEKIGVPLGQRKRLMRAITALAADGAPPAAKPAPAQRPPPPPISRADAERRPITVMFCDLVGSTNLAARLDAEDWRNLVGAYLDEASAAVTSMGGHVLKKLGDGLMALFGYPQAQENDAERAVRAALAIQRALAELNSRNAGRNLPQLSARIGIESGQVVVDAAGEVFGEAPNVAARVQAAAEPGTVLVTATVRRQTAGLFVVEDKGAQELKGVPAPVTLCHIVRASGGGRRGGVRALTPLVGREDELATLQRRWSRALEGEGQFVQIVGEPGIGKSRLVEEFRGKLAETPHTWVEWAASQLLQNTPLRPIAEWGRQRFGADLPGEQRLADLENTLALIGLDAAEYAPLIAPLVEIPLPEARAAKLAPEELRRRQLAALVAWVLAGARSQPVALAFEDLHWADPSSLDLIRAFAERGQQAPLFIMATTRPEFRPPWSVRSHHCVISLAPLNRREVRRMVGELASRHALSMDVIDGVSERTGGVPLFVEEVTRLLLERGVEGGAQAIPPTLQQSLAARLDRLGEAREVAQVGAVLGREFSYAFLKAVAAADDRGAAGGIGDTLQAALDKLAEADLLFVEGAGPEATYRFKHALIQDAAYDSLLKSRRQALHRRAAEALRDANAEPEAVAHHFTEAGLDDLAIEWWGKAGDQALRRSAFQEAIAHLGKAIDMADKGAGAGSGRAAGDVAGPGQRMKLQSDYSQAMMWSKGFAAEETKAAMARAAELAGRTDEFSERFIVLMGHYAAAAAGGELRSARELALTLLRDAEGARRVTEAGIANRCLGLIAYWHGDFVEARTRFERALDVRDPNPDPKNSERFGDNSTWAASQFAPTAWALGEVERARELISSATQRAAEIGHVAAVVDALFYKSPLEIWRGDPLATLSAAKALEVVAREHGMVQYVNEAELHSGWARGRLNDPMAGAAQVRRVLAAFVDQGVRVNLGFYSGLLAELEAETLGANSALARVDEAFGLSEQVEHRCSLPFLHRLRGEILMKRDPADPAPAEEAFRTAIAIANQQGARSPHLQAALALAKLYLSTGRSTEAHAVLKPALEGFSRTPEMPEIAEAETLLAALAETDDVKADAARRQQQQRLHVAYGNALIAARGYGAPETTKAFARARESASGDKDAPERLAADYGLWVGSATRGELPSMRAHAAAFLSDIEARPDSPEAGVAHRAAGITCWFAGEYREARDRFERALALFQPGRDDDLAFRFGHDPGIAAMAYLAIASWPLGEVDHAISLIDRMQTRISGVSHIGTLARGKMHAAMFELMRGDHARGATNALEVARLAREHDLPMFRAFGRFLQGWATAASGAIGTGLLDMRRGAEQLREQNVLNFDGLLKIALAEAEARAGDPARAVAILDEALATSDRTGYRAFEAELHRARGEILLKRDPTNPAPAEEAFLAAIAVAKRQGTRSFGLRAALALAKLYQSTGRPVDAHAVLAPALEVFSPTPEMPEIAEAQALLAALGESDEVKAETARRQRLTRLHVAYGHALFAAHGYGAPETTEAFAKARASAYGDKGAPDRLAADYGLWAGSYVRGELSSMKEHAAAFLNNVEAKPKSPEAGIAHRITGVTHQFAGEYAEAREQLERALALFQPGRDDDLAFRFGLDPGVVALLCSAIALWPIGEVDHAISLAERAQARLAAVTDVLTLVIGVQHSAMFELMRGDRVRAAQDAFELARLAREHDLPLHRAFAMFFEGWANSENEAPGSGLEDMRRGVDLLREQNILMFDGLLKIALAEAEARAGDCDRAVAILDEALATSDRTGYRAFEAELHRARGEILLRRNSASPAPAEEAFLTAIAVARQQGTRSFGLRAALSLARLYQSTGRPVEAHAVLAPALDGFSPTSEMPEIAEAQALLATLADSEEVKTAVAQRDRRLRLQTAYGQAMMYSKGFAAEETKAAFARAAELAANSDDFSERFAAFHGQWTLALARGELKSARELASTFLREAEAAGRMVEAGVARRGLALMSYFAGDFAEARIHCERALEDCGQGREREPQESLGEDTGATAMSCLAATMWQLGEVDRARELIEAANRRAAELGHVPSMAHPLRFKSYLENLRGDAAAALTAAEALEALSREHGMHSWRSIAELNVVWARSRLDDPAAGAAELQRALAGVTERGESLISWFVIALLAQSELQTLGADFALTHIDETLARASQVEGHCDLPFAHLLRGEILLTLEPANPAPAEEAFGTALAIARQQGARSWGLRAALSFAKFLRSTGRLAEAHAVLAPALEGFAPTPELPEIAEAQALLTGLAQAMA